MCRYLLSSVFLFIHYFQFAQSWTKINDFPSLERDDGTYFMIGNTAYCGTGFQVGYILSKEMFAFDMTTETWDTAAPLPNGMERQYASGFSLNDKGFIFGGIAGSTYFNDVWMYDAIAKKWSGKSSLPGVGRSGASCFVINDTAYIIGGKTAAASAINEVWAYNMKTNTWTQKNNLPYGPRWRGAATAFNDKGYLIFGRDMSNQYSTELLEYDPAHGNWSKVIDFPGKGRTYAALKSMGHDLLLVAGIDSLGKSYNDMWRFDMNTFKWSQLTPLPAEGRRGGICFNSNTTLYYTTGISQTNSRLKETWKIFNPTTIYENSWNKFVEVFPNPVSSQLTIEIQSPDVKIRCIELKNTIGQTIKIVDGTHISGKSLKIDLSDLSNGVYLLNLTSEQGIISKKVLKD